MSLQLTGAIRLPKLPQLCKHDSSTFFLPLRTGLLILVKFWASSKAWMDGFTSGIRAYTQECRDWGLHGLFLAIHPVAELFVWPDILLHKREEGSTEWEGRPGLSQLPGSATLCGASRFLLELVPLSRMGAGDRGRDAQKYIIQRGTSSLEGAKLNCL